jgi:hypothetical protein
MCDDDHNLDDVTPIGVNISSDAINGMWMGDRIAQIKGLNLTNRRDILTWLEAVVEIHDMFVAEFLANKFDELQPLELPTNPLQRWKMIRDAVIIAVRQFDDVTGVLDVLNKLGVTLDEFMIAMSTNKFEGEMNETKFLAFEQAMCSPRPVYMQIVRKYGVNRNLIKTFQELYEPLVVRTHGRGNNLGLIRKEFHEMILAGTIPDKEIVELINKKYDTTYVVDTVRWHRRQMKKKDV